MKARGVGSRDGCYMGERGERCWEQGHGLRGVRRDVGGRGGIQRREGGEVLGAKVGDGREGKEVLGPGARGTGGEGERCWGQGWGARAEGKHA